MQSKRDDEAMLHGIAKILGKEEYEERVAPAPCIHEDDGHIYGETDKRRVLRCEKCGVYYEVTKNRR
jgi:hypothetical protein